MYKDTSIDIFLQDLSDKEVEMGGGSLIGLNLASVCSLICYICNLTIGKKKYINVEKEAQNILDEANDLKDITLELIDKDKEVLEEILMTYKLREESKKEYEDALIKAVEFSFEVLENAVKVLNLVKRISKIGNLMLVSDFEIGAYMAYAAVESSVTNVKINLMNIEDENYIEKMKNKYLDVLENAYQVKEEILKITREKLK